MEKKRFYHCSKISLILGFISILESKKLIFSCKLKIRYANYYITYL
ncbi:hypothetical protein [Clostridium frigidicarnis]|nr:hypothetical protein [Clostridium frigidicarnis]